MFFSITNITFFIFHCQKSIDFYYYGTGIQILEKKNQK